MSEWFRDDHLAKIFVTTDSEVQVNAFPVNGTAKAEFYFGNPEKFAAAGDSPSYATADDCMELGAFFITLSGYLRSIKLAQDLEEISREIQKA